MDDLAFLGLELHGDGRSSFELVEHLARFDGRLYGGTALAVATATMEAQTGRGAVWSIVQFVAQCDLGAVVECRTEELARGRRASQCRVTLSHGGTLLCAGLGATGEPAADGYTAQFPVMPEVVGPDRGEAFMARPPEAFRPKTAGWSLRTEFRAVEHPTPGRMAMWARVPDHPATPAILAFLADMVPVSVARAGGMVGGGISLDNMLRFGARGDSDWVLVELEPHQSYGGYGQGLAHLWSPDGALLATGGQTASMHTFA